MARVKLSEAEKATRAAERRRAGPTTQVLQQAGRLGPGFDSSILLRAFFTAFGGVDVFVERLAADLLAAPVGSLASQRIINMIARLVVTNDDRLRQGDLDGMSLEELEATRLAMMREWHARGVDLEGEGLLEPAVADA
jgi:hypothetical protein